MVLSLECIREDKPGEKWKNVFEKTWPYYKMWFLIEGNLARPGYLTCAEEFEKYMPELLPTYKTLTELAGDSDLAARYLSMYCPPPYLSGCTQLAWTKDTIALMRNYDYHPNMFEGVMLYSNWLQPVIGVSDCNWGLLDGMNASGLAASLTFGGRKVIGKGFGIPIVMRYILETCHDVLSAVEKLKRIPVHMSYNITLVDKHHNHATVYMAPDREVVVTKHRVGVNHQLAVEWAEYAALTGTVERLDHLHLRMADHSQTESTLLSSFFNPPLYHPDINGYFTTLYTSVYRPLEMTASLYWPHKSLVQSFSHFEEQKITFDMTQPFINPL